MSDPEWIEYGKTWDEFHNDGLAIPGTLVVVPYNDGECITLIGDVNILGGVCDCCTIIYGPEIVTRYAVLVEKDW